MVGIWILLSYKKRVRSLSSRGSPHRERFPAGWVIGKSPCSFRLASVGIDAPGRVAMGDWTDAMEEGRSEEHTSELQSLMRISYAVFCLKKKKKKNKIRMKRKE